MYLSEVDRCDVYVGIFGQDYGYEDGAGISPSEREFDRATLRAKECLVFVKGASDATRHSKMQALVRKSGEHVIRRRFASVTYELPPDAITEAIVNAVAHRDYASMPRF